MLIVCQPKTFRLVDFGLSAIWGRASAKLDACRYALGSGVMPCWKSVRCILNKHEPLTTLVLAVVRHRLSHFLGSHLLRAIHYHRAILEATVHRLCRFAKTLANRGAFVAILRAGSFLYHPDPLPLRLARERLLVTLDLWQPQYANPRSCVVGRYGWDSDAFYSDAYGWND